MALGFFLVWLFYVLAFRCQVSHKHFRTAQHFVCSVCPVKKNLSEWPQKDPEKQWNSFLQKQAVLTCSTVSGSCCMLNQEGARAVVFLHSSVFDSVQSQKKFVVPSKYKQVPNETTLIVLLLSTQSTLQCFCTLSPIHCTASSKMTLSTSLLIHLHLENLLQVSKDCRQRSEIHKKKYFCIKAEVCISYFPCVCFALWLMLPLRSYMSLSLSEKSREKNQKVYEDH